jgi:hypothetical protein
MQRFFRSRKRILLLTMTTVLLIVFLSDCAVDAAVAGQRISDIKEDSVLLTSPAHSIVKRHFKFYDDKKYGDGSLKKFFIMLKIILTLFGKH